MPGTPCRTFGETAVRFRRWVCPLGGVSQEKHMDRRKFIIGAGSLAAGSAAAMGTGAFSSVQAKRALDVDVVGDASALLAMKPGEENGEYTTGSDNGAIAVDITDSNDNIAGSGVNPDAFTWIEDVFRIQNQGSQEVKLTLDPILFIEGFLDLSTDSVLGVVLVPSDGSIDVDPGWPLFDPYHIVKLPVGEEVQYTMAVFSFHADGEPNLAVDSTMDIYAEATNKQ